ncbi:DUF5682 family protein [Actinomadura algeriensis]|uniref:Uncharacterized protein n=1 Tax=Actinomadura algeriensis TaxID=1679523 RepID=A0ABR9K435_9ACTN|nr:DUF5682 family protein [Actinomadura algeriensis]MBE1537448.1 hypothetical protein [Actinomadura algeriensis]
MTVEVFGVRHHGPGSARALRAALEEFKPDAVLVEGPPEADALVGLAGDPEMVPPVALLAYSPGDPSGEGRRSAFWPFAEFSPEWQAIRYGVGAGVTVRFCDLPAAVTFAASPDEPDGRDVRLDPLGELARAAGHADAERWWDDVMEHREGGPSPFPAILDAMAELRERAGEAAVAEERREAYMRRTVRRALRDGHERVAVVCGAWHAPAVRADVPAARDDRTLRGLDRVRVAMTWVPWTHGRLAARSRYGAGVASPGWYHHLFTAPDRPVERWLAGAARVLRGEDLHVSPGQVIEAVRLAGTLAALRGRPLPGLDEVTEAARAVLCEGAEPRVDLLRDRLTVGERLGSVPPRTPMVPLQRDLHAQQRRLRLGPSPRPRDRDLDLRRPFDLDRSRLLHRLRLLDVDWGVPAGGRSTGTFRETWTLAWRPELDVALIEAGAFGTTVRGAATVRAEVLAADAADLAELTGLAERCLLADLGDALPAVLRALADRAAVDADALHLMSALPALVRTLRYGDVRGTSRDRLRAVVDGLVVRICVGLAPAVSGLDEDAARAALDHVDAVHGALALLADDACLDRWRRALDRLVARPGGLHGLVEGRVTRLLLDAGRLPDAPARMARAVSAGVEPARAAAWIEGFLPGGELSGGGLILMHDEALLRLVDTWLAELPAAAFTDVLPLLRRTFGTFSAAERRSIGDRARRLHDPRPGGPGASAPEADPARAEAATTTVRTILGWEPPK